MQVQNRRVYGDMRQPTGMEEVIAPAQHEAKLQAVVSKQVLYL
ncbi:hypothetical protein [Mesorhizobium sp. KR2-14]